MFTFFKDELHLDPASVGILMGVGKMPWVIKPLYGFMSDSIPLWGYRRRSYLVLCGALGRFLLVLFYFLKEETVHNNNNLFYDEYNFKKTKIQEQVLGYH